MTHINKNPFATSLICAGILISWVVVALHSGQALYENQHSQLLLKYGALDGHMLEQGGYWRIITSQFVHVVFLHMLCNVIFIYLLGSYIEGQFRSLIFLLVYFLGGFAGQYASVFFNPNLVSSGASQALCSLAGFLIVKFFRIWRTAGRTGIYILLFIGFQCGLDIYFAARLKEGHVFGFVAGVLLGLCVFYYREMRLRT